MINEKTTLFNYNGFITTFTGVEFDLKNPQPSMINTIDIAKSLSNICHWNGHTSLPLSVAQHSIMVSWAAPQELKPLALLHDACEAYVGDITKPLKVLLGSALDSIESKVKQAIFSRYQLLDSDYSLIKPYDLQIQKMEWEFFFEKKEEALIEFIDAHAVANPEVYNYYLWSHRNSELMFMKEFKKHFIIK